MTAEHDQARDDLAFMRSLIGGGEKFQATAGELFMWAGTLYGLQCLGEWLDTVGVIQLPPLGHLFLGVAPTAVFLIVLTRVIWRDRKAPKGGPTTRALTAVFTGAGIANLILAVVFAFGAHVEQSMTVWLYHPVVVCLFQGVAWYVAWSMRKRAWVGLVALGWFALTLTLGVTIYNVGAFLLTLGVGLILLMAIPGYAMTRIAKQSGA